MNKLCNIYCKLVSVAESLAPIIPPLLLRLILAWEFGEAGYEKYTGTNWFADLQFPFPFSLLSPDLNWTLSTWTELLGAAALALGIATRFASASLIVVTIIAITSVHWPDHWSTLSELWRGYRIVDETGDGFGNYKLPLLYILMMLPLMLGGAGKCSLDYWLTRRHCSK